MAVASRTAANAEAFAAEFEVPRGYGDYDALFADEDVDVVYIGTPIGTHVEVARRALLAGKHVLLEKAFTTTADEARELAALAAEQGRFLMEAMWMRFNPAIQRVLDEVADGAIGDVRTVQAGFGFPPPPGAIHWRPDLGGGALLDMGVYPLSFAHLRHGRARQRRGDRRDAGRRARRHGVGLPPLRRRPVRHALTSHRGARRAGATVGGHERLISQDAPFFSAGRTAC